MFIGDDGFQFDEIGTDVSLINTEINEIEMEFDMEYISKAGTLYWLLSVSFPESLRRLVFGFLVLI